MAAIILLLSICLFIPSSLSQCTKTNALPFFKRSVHEFSVDLVRRIAEDTENHFICSPLSPWTLLSAVSLGAAEETLDEIENVLRLHPHKCFNRKFFEIIQELNAVTDGAIFERASTVIADDRMQLKEVFKNRLKRTKVCNVKSLPFDNFEEVANTINDYVSTATHGTIDDIVEPTDLEGVYLILIDALYFKGSWQTKFAAEETEISTFYNEFGQPTGDVNLMFGEIRANYVEMSQISATILELPYGQSGRFSMLLLLPNNGVTVYSVLSNLKSITLASIFTSFDRSGPQKVSVQIPRFKINSDLKNMKEFLIDMGLTQMFDSSLAKFSDISDYSLYISHFIQKASVEVTEEGTEASAVTAAFFEGRSLQIGGPQFVANKPFIFMIVDRQLELALFTGAYSTPSVY